MFGHRSGCLREGPLLVSSLFYTSFGVRVVGTKWGCGGRLMTSEKTARFSVESHTNISTGAIRSSFATFK
jgi:hypothetical protein